MGYLDVSEYEAYGLDVETADALVAMASTLIEAHCRRPTLLTATYVERVRLGRERTARLSYGPLLASAVTAVRVRYGSRHRAMEDLTGQPVYGLQIASAFGLPGTWSTLDPAMLDVYVTAREVGFPTDLLGLGYSEAEITYTAGEETVPAPIKAACAQIVKNAESTPALTVRKSRLERMQLEYFAPTLIDESTRMLLKPYVAERLG